MSKNIAVLIGSASKTSFNHAVVRHLQNNVPAGIQLNILDIADLPLYDRDLDEQNVVAYHHFREAIKSADGFLWVSPEHNGQVSAMLKNAVDIGSRPAGQSLWIGKKVGFITVNASGRDKVIEQLRDLASATYINMQIAPVSAAVGGIFAGSINEQGEIVADDVKANLQNFIDGFVGFVG